MNFDLLCTNLGIHEARFEPEKLLLLKNWFQEHLSHDQHISGNELEQWEQYKEIIDSYFEVLVPALKTQPEAPTPLLEGESLISVIAETGLDSLLLKLHPESDAINQPNAEGQTPLHQAALNGWVHTIKALLLLGAKPSVMNRQKQSPLFSALMLPIDYTKKVKANKIALFELLLEKEPSLSTQQDENGDTLLHQMAIHHFGDLIDHFLLKNPQLSYVKNALGHHPIHNAILNGQVHNTKTLLTIARAAELKDSHGSVALHYAAQSGNLELIQLCATKSSLDVLNFSKKTPIMFAANQGHFDAVQHLMKSGATIDLTDAEGHNLFYYAKISKNKDLIEWCKNYFHE